VSSPAAAIGLGIAAGVFGGMFGVGGGLVMVPGMVLLMSMTQHRAHATSVAAIVAAAAAALVPMALDGQVHWPAAGVLLAGGLTGAYGGARLIDRISPIWLARAFVAIVIAAALRMGLSGPGAAAGPPAADLGIAAALGLLAAGLAAGSLAAVLGIGGGLVYVPALVALFGFVQHQAQATSLAVIVPTTLLAAVVHIRAGRVDLRRAAALGTGGVLGGVLGATSALAIDGLALRRMFAVILVIAAYRMLAGARGAAPAVSGPEAEAAGPSPR
jgi:uncharacterized membrane protein YfcA